MARHRRTLEALLADVATSARGDRAEVFSTPEMIPVNADMIEDHAINFDILHPEVKTNLDNNTQAVVDINATLDTALPDLDNRLATNKTSLDQAKLDITQAQADIESVNSIAVNAVTAAQTADTKAVAAQSKADQAAADAAQASLDVDGAIQQATAAQTAADDAKAKAVAAQSKADQATIDAANAKTAGDNAATAASAADAKAVAAQSKANQATTDAANAKAAGDNAAILANKIVTTATTDATGAPPSKGALWNKTNTDGSLIIKTWTANTDGTAWAVRQLDDAVIGNLNAATINAGIINAARFNAADIRAKFIEAGKITASDITAGTLTSASGVFGTIDASIINAGTINAARYNAADIRTKFLAAGKITASDITAGTLTSASGVFGTIDASVINAGTLNADRLAAMSISASKLAVSDLANFAPSLAESPGDWTVTGGMNIVGTGIDPSGFRLDTAITSGTAWAYGPYMAVMPGESLYATATSYRSSGATGAMYLRYYFYDKNKANLASPNSYAGAPQSSGSAGGTKFELTAVVPAGTAYTRIVMAIAGTAGNNSFYSISGRRMNGGELIVDGVILASHIKAKEITANEIKAGAITSASGVFGTVDASVLNAGTLNAARIAAGSIAASKVIVGSSFNALPDPSFRIDELTTARFARSSGTWTLNTATSTGMPSVTHLTTGTYDSFQYAPANPSTGTGGAATMQVKAGQKISMSVDMETDVSAGVRWNLYKHMADGTVAYFGASAYNTTSGRRNVAYVYTVPDGVVALDFAVACNASGVNFTVYGNGVAAIQTGATLIEDDSITTGHIKANSITATEIAADTITASQIAANAITASELAANAVTATHVLAGSIGTNHMTANSINADRLVASSITAAKLAATAIDGKKITGATIVGGEVKTTETTAAIQARMGPQSVWDPQGGTTRAGIGFSKVGTNDAYPAGMYSTDGYNVYLSQSNSGGAGGSYISLGATNQNIYQYSFGENQINSRGNVTIGSTAGSVSIDGGSGVSIGGVDMTRSVATNTQFSWSNGWSHFGGGYGNLQVREIVPGVVVMQGMAKAGTKTDGVVIGVLPANLRPNRIQNIGTTIRTSQAAPNTDQAGLLSINSNGNVSLFANLIQYCSYATISVTFFLDSP